MLPSLSIEMEPMNRFSPSPRSCVPSCHRIQPLPVLRSSNQRMAAPGFAAPPPTVKLPTSSCHVLPMRRYSSRCIDLLCRALLRNAFRLEEAARRIGEGRDIERAGELEFAGRGIGEIRREAEQLDAVHPAVERIVLEGVEIAGVRRPIRSIGIR